MKKIYQFAAILLILSIIAVTFTACAKPEVKDLLSDFEEACKSLDIRGMLNCYKPNISKPILTLMDIVGIDDTSEYLDKLTSLMGNFGNLGVSAEEFFSSIAIEKQQYSFSDSNEKCSVDAIISFGPDDNRHTIDSTIECVLVDEAWYISGISFN